MQQKNSLKPVFGAILGGLCGLAIAIVLNYVGFIASISAFVSVWLGAKLYQKFGGAYDKKMITVVTVTTFVFMILSVFVNWGISLKIELDTLRASEELAIENQELLELSFFEVYWLVMSSETAILEWGVDLLLTIVFTVLGTVYEVKRMKKEVENKDVSVEVAPSEPSEPTEPVEQTEPVAQSADDLFPDFASEKTENP